MIAVIVMITRLLIVSIVTATETMSRIKIMIGVIVTMMSRLKIMITIMITVKIIIIIML